jgi:AraC-like DNA-binding protein
MAPGFRGSLVRHELGDGVAIVEARCGPHELARTPRMIDLSAGDGILLEVNLSGDTVVTQHGRQATLRPGDGALYDTRRPYRIVLPEQHTAYLLHVPRNLIPLADDVLREAMARKTDDGLASYRLLRGYLEMVLSLSGATADPGARALMTRALADLATAVASSLCGAPAAASREVLLSALQTTIHREMSNPGLSPTYLAERHNVSIRSVYAAFALAGEAPAGYVRRLRVRHAAALLADPNLRVIDVASACGFRESSTFVRAFRGVFGMSPSAYRALPSRSQSLAE